MARLYAQAEREEPRKVALRVLELLQEHGFALDESNPSDKAKVRRWIVEAGCTRDRREQDK